MNGKTIIPISFGPWLMLDEGMTEARYAIGFGNSGYCHAVEVSVDGGDMPGGLFWSPAVKDFDAAVTGGKAALDRYIGQLSDLCRMVSEARAQAGKS